MDRGWNGHDTPPSSIFMRYASNTDSKWYSSNYYLYTMEQLAWGTWMSCSDAYGCLSAVFQAKMKPWASYQIRKIAGCACAGNAGNVFLRHRLQRQPLVSDASMHHGTCVTHVPWFMSGSLTSGGGENVPGIPGACTHEILRIWQEAHVRISMLIMQTADICILEYRVTSIKSHDNGHYKLSQQQHILSIKAHILLHNTLWPRQNGPHFTDGII